MSGAPDGSRRPGRPRIADDDAFDRDRALRVALGVFARDGFEGASVRQISREVGVSNTLLHHYFGSKQQLWEACIDHSFGAVSGQILPRLDKLLGPGDPIEKVHDLVKSYVMLSAQFPEGFQIITQEGARGGERLEYIVDRHMKGFLDVARVLIDAAAKQGLVRDVPWASLFFLVFNGGTALYALKELAAKVAAPGALDEATFLELHASATADMIVAALRPSEPAGDPSKS